MSEQYDNGQKTGFVIGAGIVSVPFIEELVRAIKGPRPLTRLVWITGGKMPGRSAPFEEQINSTVKPLLNQAAFAMGISRRDVDGYAHWLKETTRIKDPRYAFTNRPLFGDHARSFARNLLDEAHKNQALTIEIRHETVTAVLPDHAGKFDVTYASGGRLKADSGAIAVGPTRSNRLDHLLGQDGYVASPTDAVALQAVAKKSDRTSFVTLLGSGSSAIDAVRELEGAHYAGTYHIVGRGLNLWASEPRKEDSFHPNHLQSYSLSDEKTQSLIDRFARGKDAHLVQTKDVHSILQAFYQHELKSEPWLGFHHVLAAFPRKEIVERLRGSNHLKAASEVENYHDHVCAPDTIEMLAKLKKQGRLMIDKASVQDVTANPAAGFDLHLADGRVLHATTLINAVPFTTGIGPQDNRNPAFAPLIEGKYVEVNDRNIVQTNANGEAMPNLFVLGAASHMGPHSGVESFRDLAHAAGLAAAEALRGPDTSRPRSEAKPILPLPRIYPQPNRGSAHVY